MRRGLPELEMSQAAGDLVLGAMAALWAFAMLAYLIKLVRRPGVLAEDLAVLPGAAGLASATMAMMSVAGGMDGIAPQAGRVLLWAGLALHLALAAAFTLVMLRQPAERRAVSPVYHLVYGGFVVGGVAACRLGDNPLAGAILWPMIGITALIWGASLWQLRRALPPPPLRPLLILHVAPAALMANIALQTGHPAMGQGFLGLSLAMLMTMALAGRWMMAARFSPLWGAMIYPVAAVIGACFVADGGWSAAGFALSVLAFGAAPALAWNVLRLWPGGRLAALTNAARA